MNNSIIWPKRSIEVALRLFDSAQDTFEQLAAMPKLGARREVTIPALAGLRWFRVRGFEKYMVFYRINGETVEIVRVLHGARDIESILESE